LIFDFRFQNEFDGDLRFDSGAAPRKLSGLQIQIRQRPRRSRHERFLGTDLAENVAVGTE